jgi:hypothetical protein
MSPSVCFSAFWVGWVAGGAFSLTVLTPGSFGEIGNLCECSLPAICALGLRLPLAGFARDLTLHSRQFDVGLSESDLTTLQATRDFGPAGLS